MDGICSFFLNLQSHTGKRLHPQIRMMVTISVTNGKQLHVANIDQIWSEHARLNKKYSIEIAAAKWNAIDKKLCKFEYRLSPLINDRISIEHRPIITESATVSL